jgi:hypothetical protein
MSALPGSVLALVTFLAAMALPTECAAASQRIDDSATMPAESTALLRWRHSAPSRGRPDLLEGAVRVAVRLDLTPWLNRTGRIYLVLPQQGTTPVRVAWTTQGRLLPGEIRPGQRTLVFAGPVSSPRLEETLVLRIEADAAGLEGKQSLDFHFEFDTD